MFRYLEEQTFRFNERKLTDAERFSLAVASVRWQALAIGSFGEADGLFLAQLLAHLDQESPELPLAEKVGGNVGALP